MFTGAYFNLYITHVSCYIRTKIWYEAAKVYG